MRLVQKLTGLCPADDGDDGEDEGQTHRRPPAPHRLSDGDGDGDGGGAAGQFQPLPPGPFSPDFPVFRPASGSADVFYNIAGTVFAGGPPFPPIPPPALGSAISPAVMEIMRGYPDYHRSLQ